MVYVVVWFNAQTGIKQNNNKFMQSYVLLKLLTYLMYFDVNNLYDCVNHVIRWFSIDVGFDITTMWQIH